MENSDQEILRNAFKIQAKWSTLHTQVPLSTIRKATEPVIALMTSMSADCVRAGVDPQRLPNHQPFIEQLEIISKLSFWIGFDYCITGKVPPLFSDMEQNKRNLIEQVPVEALSMLKEISEPNLEDMFMMAQATCTVTGKKEAELNKLQMTIGQELLTFLTGTFTIGVLEATIKLKDIPVQYHDGGA